MRVLINGLPYFGKKVAKELNEFDRENTYIFLDTYYSKWDKIRFLLNLPFCKAVISFNGVSDRSGSLDKVLSRHKKLIMQWHGTDVSLAVSRNKNGTIYKEYINNARHLFSAPWFQDELKEVVPNGIYAPFSYVDHFGNDQKYDKLSVLSYIAKGREEFYGWSYLLAAARDLPNVEFVIVGSDGKGIEVPDNVLFLGWVDENKMIELYKSHPVFVRLCEHDGKAFSVSQALATGAEVIWNYPLEGVHQIELSSEALIDAISRAFQQVISRKMSPNQENIKFASEELSRDKVFSHYTSQIKKLLNDQN